MNFCDKLVQKIIEVQKEEGDEVVAKTKAPWVLLFEEENKV